MHLLFSRELAAFVLGQKSELIYGYSGGIELIAAVMIVGMTSRRLGARRHSVKVI